MTSVDVGDVGAGGQVVLELEQAALVLLAEPLNTKTLRLELPALTSAM